MPLPISKTQAAAAATAKPLLTMLLSRYYVYRNFFFIS
jgi:hypothetical protein